MDRDPNKTSALPPPSPDETTLLRSIGEGDGRGEDHMIETALRPVSRDQLPTSQEPVSAMGWSLTIVAGLVLWAVLFHFVV